MEQRQKIIVVALAIPVLAMVAYFATRDNGDVAVPPAPTPTATEMTTDPDSAAAPQPTTATAAPTAPAAAPSAAEVADDLAVPPPPAGSDSLAAVQERAQAHLKEVEALTQEKYDALRATHKNLPATLKEYQDEARKHADNAMKMTPEEFDRHQQKKKGAEKGKKGGKKKNKKDGKKKGE